MILTNRNYESALTTHRTRSSEANRLNLLYTGTLVPLEVEISRLAAPEPPTDPLELDPVPPDRVEFVERLAQAAQEG